MIILGKVKEIELLLKMKGAAWVLDKKWCLVNDSDDNILKLFPVERYDE